MEIKAKDMCPRCKYYLGMTPQGMYSCGKTYDDSELNIGIDVVLNCANFEWKDEKVEGKAGDICPNCKNRCEDLYDGMVKTLDADSDICCSMFEPRASCETCERFDGTYCHGSNGTITISYKAYGMEAINCPEYEEKKEPLETKTAREIELEAKIMALLSEKAEHQKANEALEERNNSQFNRIREKNKIISELEEKLKKANKLADSWKKDYERLRDRSISENKKSDKKISELEKKLHKADSIRDAVWNEAELNKKISELEACAKYWGDIVLRQDGQIINFKDEVNKLKQTISDQEITIKALLLTIKEMCKDERCYFSRAQ